MALLTLLAFFACFFASFFGFFANVLPITSGCSPFPVHTIAEFTKETLGWRKRGKCHGFWMQWTQLMAFSCPGNRAVHPPMDLPKLTRRLTTKWGGCQVSIHRYTSETCKTTNVFPSFTYDHLQSVHNAPASYPPLMTVCAKWFTCEVYKHYGSDTDITRHFVSTCHLSTGKPPMVTFWNIPKLTRSPKPFWQWRAHDRWWPFCLSFVDDTGRTMCSDGWPKLLTQWSPETLPMHGILSQNTTLHH